MLIPSALQFLKNNIIHLPQSGTVVDFGDQNLFDPGHAGRCFPDFVDRSNGLSAYQQVTLLYSLLGLVNRKCVDYNDNADHRLDLNYSALSNPEIESSFDVVTNQGFSEHVFNQHAVFEAIHHCCKRAGLMFHVLPCQGWADNDGYGHGFYQYQPNFFRHLALANNYTILDIEISPFSPDDHLFKFVPEEYSKIVNFHMVEKDFLLRRKLGRSVFCSLLVLMKMPELKHAFVCPNE